MNVCEFGGGDLSKFSQSFYSWLSNVNPRKSGTIIKSIFLSQISITEGQLQDKVKGPNMSDNDWKEIAKDMKLEQIPHAWFILKEYYRRYKLLTFFSYSHATIDPSNLNRTMPILKKRVPVKVEGIPIPSLPTIKDVKKFLSEKTIESFLSDPFLDPKKYDEEVAEALNTGKIYLGILSHYIHILFPLI